MIAEMGEKDENHQVDGTAFMYWFTPPDLVHLEKLIA